MDLVHGDGIVVRILLLWNEADRYRQRSAELGDEILAREDRDDTVGFLRPSGFDAEDAGMGSLDRTTCMWTTAVCGMSST